VDYNDGIGLLVDATDVHKATVQNNNLDRPTVASQNVSLTVNTNFFHGSSPGFSSRRATGSTSRKSVAHDAGQP